MLKSLKLIAIYLPFFRISPSKCVANNHSVLILSSILHIEMLIKISTVFTNANDSLLHAYYDI